MKKLLAACSILVLCGNVGAEMTTEQVLQDIRQKSDRIQSCSFTRRTQYYEGVQADDSTEETIHIKKPGLTRNEFVSQRDGKLLTVADGSWFWLLTADGTRVMKRPLAPQEANLDFFPLTVLGAGGETKFLRQDVLEGEDVYILEHRSGNVEYISGTAEAAARVIPQRLEYAIRVRDGVVLKKTHYAVAGNIIREETYSHYQINADMPESLFQFVVPAGAEVMEQ